MRRILTTLIALVPLALVSSAALAQKSARPQTHHMKTIIVRGTPPTPSVVYILDRSRDLVKQRSLSKRFTTKIVKSVDHKPF